jgi:polyisoprenoid-binding protein YceI
VKCTNVFGSFVLSVLVAGSALAADTYNLDPAHSDVAFSIEHLVINTVQGRFKDLAGSVTLDDSNAVTEASATIQTKSIDTGIEKRDNHLRSADFFDVEQHPTLTFEGKKVVEEASKKALVGTLTMHGVSKEISLPFTIKGPIKDPWGGTRIGIAAETEINRTDYGMKHTLGVGDQVKIRINAEAVKK